MKYCFVFILGLFVLVQTTLAATCTCTATSYPEGEPATAVATNGSSLCSMSIDALNAHINSVINKTLANQPVTKFLYFGPSANREFYIKKFDISELKIVGDIIDKINIGNGQTDRTSTILAYRKQYTSDDHGSGLGAIFFNLEKLFPCAKGAPLCHLYPLDGDGFRKGKAIIDATDGGNNLNIFGSIRTYGFAFTGCAVLNGANGCLSSSWERVLACYLPYSCLETA